MIGSFAVSLLWAAGVVAAIVVFPTLRVRPVLYVTAAAAILPFCYVYFVWGWEKLRLRYRLTTVRLVRREGVVFRREQELELAQVGEVEVEQAMMDRLFNTGTVVVHARDGNDPALRLEEVDRPHDVKDRIRTAALHRRKGVAFVEKR
jgi:membrane protein YdbS with pleckstrin-like domain